jgi:hypothetical protein
MGIAVRAALVGLAVVAMAWLVFGLRAVRLEDEADAVIDKARAGPVSEAEVRKARDRLREAGEFSPDMTPMIKVGQLLQAQGRDLEAALVARAAAIEEPDSLRAWFLAWEAHPDGKRKEEALDELRRLNPYIDVALHLRVCPDCPLIKKKR